MTFGRIGVLHWAKHTWPQPWAALIVRPKGKGKGKANKATAACSAQNW